MPQRAPFCRRKSMSMLLALAPALALAACGSDDSKDLSERLARAEAAAQRAEAAQHAAESAAARARTNQFAAASNEGEPVETDPDGVGRGDPNAEDAPGSAVPAGPAGPDNPG